MDDYPQEVHYAQTVAAEEEWKEKFESAWKEDEKQVTDLLRFANYELAHALRWPMTGERHINECIDKLKSALAILEE